LNYSSIQKQKKTDNIQAATYELKRNRQDLHKQAAAAAQSHLMHNKQVVNGTSRGRAHPRSPLPLTATTPPLTNTNCKNNARCSSAAIY